MIGLLLLFQLGRITRAQVIVRSVLSTAVAARWGLVPREGAHIVFVGARTLDTAGGERAFAGVV